MEIDPRYEDWHKVMAAGEADQADPLYPWHRTVLKLLPDLNGKDVLEVGCGRGDFARVLGRLYPSARIVGTDFSSTAIEAARAKSSDSGNVAFQVEDAQNLSFRESSFDYVISCECLEHVESPAAMLSNISRCLRKGGGFIVTTENYANGMILAWLRSWLTGVPFNSGSGVQPRENFFVYWKVRSMIEFAGLTITHMESNHFIWLLLPGFSPDTFFTEDFSNPVSKRLFRPLGRHFSYQGIK